jgi:dephospho-CoA kinase
MNLFLKKNKSTKVVILDIPLLLENKLNQETDVIIFVEANKKLLQKNLEKRTGYNKKIIEMLKKIQLTKEEKKLAADIVVENNFNPQNTRLRVKQVLDRILI